MRQFGQSEIQDLGLAALGDENVGGLDIAMDDAFGVRGVERIGDLYAEIENFVDRASGPVAMRCLQRLAFKQLHGDEGLAFVLVDLVNGADVGMIQGGGRARFTLEALERLDRR